MKKCTKCKVEKPLSEFYKAKSTKDGYDRRCKKCKIFYQKDYIQENIDGKRKYDKKYYKKNKNRFKEANKKNQKQRHSTDIKYRLQQCLRVRINQSVHRYNFKKIDTSIKELGCSMQKYTVYLEQQFTDEMNWDNYGTYWEIDHIHPLSKGGSFHYTNTQPLTVTENRVKGAKL